MREVGKIIELSFEYIISIKGCALLNNSNFDNDILLSRSCTIGKGQNRGKGTSLLLFFVCEENFN